MSLEELDAAIEGGFDSVLIEFCVPSGCSRCEEMQAPIERLAGERRDWLAVRRVDLRRYPQLAWEFGLTACPSYVAFRGGKEVLRASGPASADRLASGLDRAHREGFASQFSVAAN